MLPLEVLDIPGEIKVGYSPIGFVRCGRAACRVTKVLWKIGKETGGKKMEEPHSLKSNEMAEVTACASKANRSNGSLNGDTFCEKFIII